MNSGNSVISVGLAAIDPHRLWHWEGLLRATAGAACQVAARYSYADEAAPRGGAIAPHIWLIDAPAPRLLPRAALAWLHSLAVPALLICSQLDGMGRLAGASAPLLICHPSALARSLPLAALLALGASSRVSAGPLYLGIEPPAKHAGGATAVRSA